MLCLRVSEASCLGLCVTHLSVTLSLKMTHPPLPSSQLGEQDQLPTACRLTCDVLHCTIHSTTSFYTFSKKEYEAQIIFDKGL